MEQGKEKGCRGCSSISKEEQLVQNRRMAKLGCATIIKEANVLPLSFYIYIILLFLGPVGYFIRLPWSHGTSPRATLGATQTKQSHSFTKTSELIYNPNNTLNTNYPTTPPRRPQHTLICPPSNMTQTCPTNLPPLHTLRGDDHEPDHASTETCPDYFGWIYEDLKPWKANGITREAIEAGTQVASFRLVVLQGRVYVETYEKSLETRDVFTIWGIIQLIRVYPDTLPDLDLIFQCGNYPVISKANYSAPLIPPMFHYCGDDHHFDIVFPDWSFWGWKEKNIKPWEALVKDLKEGNERVRWEERVPYAFWKGNVHMGRRVTLLRCNSTQDWNAQILKQKWAFEVKHGFRKSNLADQCTHRYKIYMEGKAWSVSEKYIQACDSMTLLIHPRYYEFFTRSLVPLKHYWPINPRKLCESIKFAVDWGNNHTEEAQIIGKEGTRFIFEELKMKNIYDYMFHILSEYAKLLKYKPMIPPYAIEVCLESMVCNSQDKEKKWKIDSMAKGPFQTSPCTMPPPYDPHQLRDFFNWKNDVISKVERWVEKGDIEEVNFV